MLSNPFVWYYQTPTIMDAFDPMLALVFAVWIALGIAVPLIFAPTDLNNDKE